MLSGAGGPTAPAVIKDIPYSGAAKGDRRRSFDLYLPAKSSTKPPLLIFVHGGFWLLSDDEYRIGPSIADNLIQDGVAVALLRYRLAPAYRHPTQAEDIAAGVAYLIKNADKFGFDGKRIFLAGHSAGGHLASLVALDASYLNHHGVMLNSLAGVISISGLYDLAPTWNVSQNQKSATASAFGKDPAVLKSASPIQYVHAGAPPFFILSAFQDFPGFALDARRFADALRKAGNQKIDQLMLKGADHFTSVKLDDENQPVRRAILGFMGVKPAPPELAEWIAAKRRWTSPPYSTLPFWQYHKLVRSYPIDEGLRERLRFVFRQREEELLEWPLKRYHAIDLFSYLDALPKERVGEGDTIILTNIRGEKQVWKQDQIERFKPVIVIGVDEERNLFRFSSFYRMYHEYSWKPGGATPTLALTLGAFIHFLEKPLPELAAQSWHFGLTDDSFQRSKTDPLKAVRDVPKDVEEALTFRNGCVYCHSFRGVGAASHHVNAMTGKPQGGFALALESYPPEVWKTFMFDQETVAKKMGATPNIVRDSVRQPLFELVNQSRRQQAQPNK
ncbi:MAG: alpha/beta hydrolase [Candidatus Binatia bacterium]